MAQKRHTRQISLLFGNSAKFAESRVAADDRLRAKRQIRKSGGSFASISSLKGKRAGHGWEI
jgi:hypothetical protein